MEEENSLNIIANKLIEREQSRQAKMKKIATAKSELFVSEVIEPILKKDYPELSENFYIEVPNEWEDIWNEADFPEHGKSNVVDEFGTLLGIVTWDVNFIIEKHEGSRYIEAEPVNVQFTPA